MKIERTLKRDNGDKIIIIFENKSTYSSNTPLFDVSISVTPKGKRKPTVDTCSCSFGENVFGWEWRSWDMDVRKEKTKDYILQLVTIEEIRSVRDELLDAMRTDSYRF